MKEFTDYTSELKEIVGLIESLLDAMDRDDKYCPRDQAALLASFGLISNRIPTEF
jgi:hypothetical protein